MTFPEFISASIGAGLIARWLVGWVVGGLRLFFSMADALRR